MTRTTGISVGLRCSRQALTMGLLLLSVVGCESKEEASARRRLERQIGKLRSDDPEVSVMAAINLGNKGLAAEGAVDALIEALSRPEEAVRRHAAHALGKIGPVAEDAIGPLKKLLADDGPVARVWAVQALVKIDPAAEPHVDVLIEALEHSDLGVRINAAGAIADIGRRAKAAVPALIGGLKHPELARHAVHALGAIGPPASDAIKPLRRLAKGQGRTAEAAREALAKIR